MNVNGQRTRNDHIVASAVAGRRAPEIAAEVGMAASSVRAILSQARDAGQPVPIYTTAPIRVRRPIGAARCFEPQAAKAVRHTIKAYLDSGMSQRQTAAALGVSLGFVQRTVHGESSMTKRCPRCDHTKPIAQFLPTTQGDGSPRRHPWCDDCRRAHARDYQRRRSTR